MLFLWYARKHGMEWHAGVIFNHKVDEAKPEVEPGGLPAPYLAACQDSAFLLYLSLHGPGRFRTDRCFTRQRSAVSSWKPLYKRVFLAFQEPLTVEPIDSDGL